MSQAGHAQSEPQHPVGEAAGATPADHTTNVQTHVVVHIEAGTLWSDGGTAHFIAAGAVTATVTSAATPRSLELYVPSTTTRLDLTALPDDVVLHLRGGAALRELALPTGGACWVHLDLEAPPRLHITGDIGWLDACWNTPGKHQTLSSRWNEVARSQRPHPLRNAWLGPADGIPDDVQLIAIPHTDASTLDLTSHTAAAVVIDHGEHLLEVQAGTCELLWISSTAYLRKVEAQAARAVSITRAPRIQSVQAEIEQLSLLDSAFVPVLHIPQRVGICHIHRQGPSRLQAPKTHHLSLTDTSRVKQVHIAPQGNRDRLDRRTRLLVAMHALSQGQALDDLMLSHVMAAIRHMAPWEALELLLDARQQGAHARDVWSLRMRLGRLIRKRSGRDHDDAKWFWPIADQVDRPWRADLALWRACREDCRSASDYVREMVTSADPEHLAAVATDMRTHDDMIDVLARQLEHGVTLPPVRVRRRHRSIRIPPWHAGRKTLPPDQEEDPDVMAAMQRVIRGLARCREHPRAPELLRSFCAWLVQRLPNASGISTLCQLQLFGCPHASDALAELAAHPEMSESLRHRILLGQLTEPTTTLFDLPEHQDV